LLQERFDLVELVFVQLQVGGPDDAVDLIRAPTMAPVTAGWLRVQAIATSAGETP
jgi:hypothetical protein